MNHANLQTQKPVEKLNLSDFIAFPVWEYAIDDEGVDDQDETWVRPVDTNVVPKRSYVHVAVEFISASGHNFNGYVTVSTLDGTPDVCQGSIFHGAQSLFVSNPEAFCDDESRSDLLTTLNLNETELFPLTFRLRVPVVGHAAYQGGTLP